jgi:hypothetical protein
MLGKHNNDGDKLTELMKTPVNMVAINTRSMVLV